MKTSLLRRVGKPLFLLGTLLIGPMASYGQTRTWTTTAPGGDTGNWSDATKWSGSNVPDSAGESALFGAYANNRTVALDGDFTIGTLTIVPRTSGFSSTTFALTGSNTLTLNGGFVIGGGTSISIAPNLVIAADQVWTTQNETGVAAATISGVVSGTGKITRTANGGNTSAGVITFSGSNTFSGGITQNAALNTTRLGTSSVVTSGTLSSGPLGVGTVTLNAGVLSSDGATARTLQNNIVVGGPVVFGRSGNTGALTFSDAGLTTATTFTLGAAASNAVNTIRSFATNLTFDQVIAESGGTNQSVLFSSVSGTPTVTLNKTKTAGGSIVAGGVNLVLNNGAAQSGSLLGVNGSISATGSNKFSDGLLIVDGSSLIASDASNFSEIESGRAAVYNNGRVSFSTTQTQAAVASLFTADSSVRLGLGSGSGNASFTENYNQSQIGNGKAGLVSASSGTSTYTGVLTAGSDNTFRVGGGAGVLALTGNTLTGSGKNVIVEGGGTVIISGNQDYSGSTVVNSNATLSGTNGALSATSGITVNNASLTIDNATSNSNRINNAASITLNRSNLSFNGNTGGVNETFSGLVLNGGFNTITLTTAPTGGATKILDSGTVTRSNNSLLLVRGDNFGPTTSGTIANRNLLKIGDVSASLVGGGGAVNTTNVSILPWAIGATSAGSTGGTFVTYDSASGALRLLDTTTEFAQALNGTNINTAIGGNTDRNVRATSATTGNTLLSADATVNSLLINNTGATATQTYSLGGNTLTITSGALQIFQAAAQAVTVNTGTVAFGGNAGVITNGGNQFLTTLSTVITGSAGVTVAANGGAAFSLGGANTFSGGLTVSSQSVGYVGVSNDAAFGNAANSVTHAGGELRFFTGFTTTRGLILQGAVGDNTLGNNGSNTMTWNGAISGDGRLRLVNNASTVSTAGFVLGGTNTYTGGTQIEGINVSGANDSSFGTGSVTLLSANGNVASLTLTSAAPTLGGLRGTDGTVTINPTGSSATLTVGANNESTVFAGAIAQGAGKTGSLTKTGTGTLVLAGDNSFTGTTSVNGGVLNLTGRTASTAYSVANTGTLLVNSAVSTGNITVGNGATLGGSGTVTSAVTIQSGGTLSPGNSPGLPSYANLTLETSSNFKFELVADTTAGRGTNFDGVNILSGGSLTIQSGVTSSLVFNSTGSSVDWSDTLWASDQSWLVFDLADNNYAGPVFSVAGVSNDSLGQSLGSVRSGASFSYTVVGGDIYLNYTAVPEPTTLAMLGLGAAWLCGSRRRRSVRQA